MSKFFETKDWDVDVKFVKFYIKGIPLTVRFTAHRTINKWLWNFYKSDTITFHHNYTESRKKLINSTFGEKEARRLQILVDIEMMKLKLKHLR